MIAWLGIRPEPVYRREAFAAGLKAVGCDVRHGSPQIFGPDTVYCCWGRHGENASLCDRMERAGGLCLIAENGYLNVGGSSPHGDSARNVYAIAVGHHNDERAVRHTDPERWARLGVNLVPWRASGGHVLVCPNRSFGEPGRIMPVDWPAHTVNVLRRHTKREIRVRVHPGNSAPRKPLADDLAGAWACVVFHSSAGLHALIGGIPTIVCGPKWIAKSAAGARLDEVENPPTLDRLPAMHKVASAQWFLSEIESGEAFKTILRSVK